MMKLKEYAVTILGVLTLVLFASTGNAGGFYGGAQYSVVDMDVAGESLDFSTVSAIGGIELTNAVALEARYGQGQSDDDVYGTDIEVDSVFGVYGIFSLPNETNVEPYLVLGYTRGKLSMDGYGSDSESDFSYGAGVSFKLAESLSVRGEYMILLDGEGYEFNSLSASLVYNF
jgi:outer membrane immunogenic protein